MNARLSDLEKWLSPPKGGLWHGGPSVLGTLRGVKPEVAAWRPAANRHSIWELVLHLAYWKYAVRRRIEDGPRGGFPRTPSDWPDQPDEPDPKRWKADRDPLRVEHEALLDVVRGFDPARLDQIRGGAAQWSYMDLMSGIVIHDAYHVGQIQLMKRLYQSLSAHE